MERRGGFVEDVPRDDWVAQVAAQRESHCSRAEATPYNVLNMAAHFAAKLNELRVSCFWGGILISI